MQKYVDRGAHDKLRWHIILLWILKIHDAFSEQVTATPKKSARMIIDYPAVRHLMYNIGIFNTQMSAHIEDIQNEALRFLYPFRELEALRMRRLSHGARDARSVTTEAGKPHIDRYPFILSTRDTEAGGGTQLVLKVHDEDPHPFFLDIAEGSAIDIALEWMGKNSSAIWDGSGEGPTVYAVRVHLYIVSQVHDSQHLQTSLVRRSLMFWLEPNTEQNKYVKWMYGDIQYGDIGKAEKIIPWAVPRDDAMRTSLFADWYLNEDMEYAGVPVDFEMPPPAMVDKFQSALVSPPPLYVCYDDMSAMLGMQGDVPPFSLHEGIIRFASQQKAFDVWMDRRPIDFKLSTQLAFTKDRNVKWMERMPAPEGPNPASGSSARFALPSSTRDTGGKRNDDDDDDDDDGTLAAWMHAQFTAPLAAYDMVPVPEYPGVQRTVRRVGHLPTRRDAVPRHRVLREDDPRAQVILRSTRDDGGGSSAHALPLEATRVGYHWVRVPEHWMDVFEHAVKKKHPQ